MGDNLQQPDTPAPMKVFQGGGTADGIQAPESLLPLPSQKVDMIEYKGGGFVEQKKDVNVSPFRGVSTTNIPDSLKKNTLILELGNELKPIRTDGTFQVLPVIFSKRQGTEQSELKYLEEQTIHNIPIQNLYFFSPTGGELSHTNSQTLFTSNNGQFILFFTDKLKSKTSVFVPVKEENENNNSNISDIQSNLSINNKSSIVTQMPNIQENDMSLPITATRTLASGHIVRFVDDSVKGDIQALKFTHDEKEIFNQLFKVGRPFIKEFLQRPENKEEWFNFWRLFINLDGTSNMTIMTRREGREISNFLQRVLDAYRKYLFENAIGYLLSTEVQASQVKEENVEDTENQVNDQIQKPVSRPNDVKPVTKLATNDEGGIKTEAATTAKQTTNIKGAKKQKVEKQPTNENDNKAFIEQMIDEEVDALESIVKKGTQMPNDFVKEMLQELLDVTDHKPEIIKEFSETFPEIKKISSSKNTFSAEKIQAQCKAFLEALQNNESYKEKREWKANEIIEEYFQIFLYLDIKRFPKEDPLRSAWYRIYSTILLDKQSGKSSQMKELEGYSKAVKETFTGGTRKKKLTSGGQRRSRTLKKARSKQTN